ncbi:hypothetical protein M3Y96_00753400 [Aphelenchoides besseyi]|nr:hypothetical protein M3Y96_00753400 [Aphelenchoides besseyi]
MLLISKIRNGITAVTPIAVHFFMVAFVASYTILGAYCIRALENARINEINRANGFGLNGEPSTRSKRANDLILTGAELAAVAPDLRPCVQKAIRDLLTLGLCHPHELKTISITTIDDCYRNAEINLNRTKPTKQTNEVSYRPRGFLEDSEEDEPGWNLHNSLVFAFSIITTIGYGNVAPISFEGRLFCLFYGLFGIPLALLTVADIGLFLSKAIKKLANHLTAAYRRIRKWHDECQTKSVRSNTSAVMDLKLQESQMNELNGSSPNTQAEEADEMDQMDGQPKRETNESILLAIIFALYLIVGSFCISFWLEPQMSFFVAFYYSFISLTTIGLGDVIPRNFQYLPLTFLYLGIGLALTTMAIEIASDLLKKIHYFGRKVDAHATEIWFGGKKMTLKNLIGHLSDQLNIPIEQLEGFNINTFIQDSIKVADGELKTLRISDTAIDTATLYGNHYIIGQILQEYYEAGKLKREDVFITTKRNEDYTMKWIDNGSHLDPIEVPHIETWRKLEHHYKAGILKSIRVSNFTAKQLQELYDQAEIELHIYHRRRDLVELCKRLNISVISYATLGSPGRLKDMKKVDPNHKFPDRDLLHHPLVLEIAKKHNKTAAQLSLFLCKLQFNIRSQVLLRHLIQLKISVIPKSLSPKCIENFWSFRLPFE